MNFLLLSIFCVSSLVAFPTPQYGQQNQNPAVKQEVTGHYGFMYSPQPLPTYQPSASQTSSSTLPPLLSSQIQLQKPLNSQPAQLSINDPDFQMLARSLHSGTASVGLSQQQILPCSSDGRSVTIDHLRISPDSLVQIARLAQAFGSNPDWNKVRLADLKSTLESPMNPTNKFSARSIGL